MEGGPCSNCGEVPFSLWGYFTTLSAIKPCEHCGAELTPSRQAWTGFLVLGSVLCGILAMAMVPDEAVYGDWRFWAEAGLFGLLAGGLLGALYGLIPWKLGWWSVVSEGEGAGE